MPIFDDTTTHHPIDGTTFGYSGTRIEDLGSSEYTLVSIAADQSGSVHSFRSGIEDCLAAIATASRAHPRSDHLMLRLTAFDNQLHEVHGFKPVRTCDPGAYASSLRAGGSTALYDAAHNAVSSVVGYGKDLTERGFTVNGVVLVITDGLDNASAVTPERVAEAVSAAITSESLEGVTTILVGVNVTQPSVGQALMALSTAAGFDHYLELGDADVPTLARLADFATRSIALSSTALGAGSRIHPLR